MKRILAMIGMSLLLVACATAYIISQTIKQMFFWSISFGVASAVIGYYAAKFLNTSIAGMMAATVGLLFIVVIIIKRSLESSKKKQLQVE